MRIRLLLVAALALPVAPASFAASPSAPEVYWSVAGGTTRVEFDGRTETLTTLNVTVGARVHQNLDVEAFYGDNLGGGGDDLEYQSFGARLKPHVTLTDYLRVYGQVGGNEVKLSRGGTNPAERSVTSVLYGVGGVMKLGPTTSLFVEYNSYLNDEDDSVTGFNWGVSQRF